MNSLGAAVVDAYDCGLPPLFCDDAFGGCVKVPPTSERRLVMEDVLAVKHDHQGRGAFAMVRWQV